MKVQLYDATDIDTLPWPDTEDGQYAKRFLIPLVKNGVQHYIDNIDTEIFVLTIDDLVLPLTVNDAQYQNSYVCSPYGQYVAYALEYVNNLKNQVIQLPLKLLIRSLGKLLKLGRVNKVAIVNNWLFATNLYPVITQEQIAAIKCFLEKRFPQHAILFRSVNTFTGQELYQGLERNGFSLIASRPIYFLKTDNESIFSSRIFKSDFKLLRESTHQVIESPKIGLNEVSKITSLYKSVYLTRHSMHNPQLNSRFIQLALENRLFDMVALQKEGVIEAVAGYFYRNGVMTSPFLGYDTDQSQENKLYRLTCTVLTQEARKKKMLFHLSSGAAFYKKIRKAETAIEYMAVSHKHLPVCRRLPWQVLRGVSNSVGILFMKHFDQ